ncbi:MAG: L-threonylcarbamoyladenylate synthase, partial [Calditrichota bacterium]
MRHDIHILNPNARFINRAVEMLETGSVVLYPTDTVYGMGCSIYQKKALERLYRIKGKSPSDPMSLLCDSIQQASGFVKINNFAFKILKRCMPGPFTIILEATRETPKLLLGKKREIGIRIPDSETCRLLVEGLGHPLINSSASNEALEDLQDGDFSIDYANA